MKSILSLALAAVVAFFGVSCKSTKKGSVENGDPNAYSGNDYSDNVYTQGGGYNDNNYEYTYNDNQGGGQGGNQSYGQPAGGYGSQPSPPADSGSYGTPANSGGGNDYVSYQSPSTPSYGNSGGSGQSYTVRKGDNLYRISLRHGTTVDKLMAANGLNTTLIHPGDVLSIP